jgi:hypothetical protein
MRLTTPKMERTWRGGDYIGERAPRARVTVQRPKMRLHRFGMKSTFTFLKPAESGAQDAAFAPLVDPNRPSPVSNTYADFLFSAVERPLELPNVASIEWERTTDTDAATCTVTLYNTKPREPGEREQVERGGRELDHQGYYTHDHGTTQFSRLFGHRSNEFKGMLMPDNLIRTYEGYGWDLDKIAEDDPNLMQTGLWIIDSVQMSADGEGIPTIILQCRDMMRLLLDQIAFPTVVPPDFYPLQFASFKERFKVGEEEVKVGEKPNGTIDWGKADEVRATIANTSNDAWPDAQRQNIIKQHPSSNILDNDPGTYWVSIGNSTPSAGFSYEYVTFKTYGATVSGVRFKTYKAGYTVYLSMKVDGRWRGKDIIQYSREGVGRNDANIRYLTAIQTNNEDEFGIAVPAVKNVEEVRLTFGNLQPMSPGYPGKTRDGNTSYRAGLRQAIVVAGPPSYEGVYEKRDVLSELRPGPAGSNPGRAKEYTEIVKLVCAWAGFYWPQNGRQMLSGDGRRVRSITPAFPDSDVLGAPVTGQVWGDFQDSGTMAVAPLQTDAFDKKPLMDAVNVVKDILGFVFYCDESGAVQWRLPNIYEVGNLYSGINQHPGRTRKMYTIDEKVNLTSLTSTLDSKNVREVVFVANSTAQIGAVAAGWNPNYVGLRRTAGWTDQRFGSEGGDEDAKRLAAQAKEQTRQMADMITIRQLFTYRTDQITIPGFPGIQIDDQIRIVERVTAEGYIHYVKGISSSHDLRTGEWTYNLQTHWLGDRVGGRWVMDRTKLAPVTRDYLNRVQAKQPVEQSRYRTNG